MWAGGIPLMDAVGKKRLKLLGFRRYGDYLKSPRWRKFVQMWPVLSGRPKACAVPRCRRKRIQLHHLTYQRLGRERVGDVMPLCGTHHKRLHLLQKHRRRRYASESEAVAVLVAFSRRSRRRTTPRRPPAVGS
jgi:hypothetical protein